MGGAGTVIDLHTHTTASDGTDTAQELVQKAERLGLEAIAITDHDVPLMRPPGSETVEVIRGIELSAKGRLHLLGYFFGDIQPGFDSWLEQLKDRRRQRNLAMAEKLRNLGVPVTVAEAEGLGARATCRPHFARIMVDKGYVSSLDEAFERYLGEDAPAFVERDDPEPEEVIERACAAGAVTSLAHPVRLRHPDEDRFLARLARAGLHAIEAFHSDHSAADTQRYLAFAARLDLAVTGGSDYHGANKPNVLLGSGRRFNVQVPRGVLEDLRRRAVDL